VCCSFKDLKLIKTSDGSHTIAIPSLDETYHSHHGAITESKHVFIHQGLDVLINKIPKMNILEVGLGTGLNALLTWEKIIIPQILVKYTAIEPYPLPASLVEKLNYASYLKDLSHAGQSLMKLHATPQNLWMQMDNNFHIFKSTETIQTFPSGGDGFHLVYFDAFAPNKQPEMWTAEVLSKIYQLMLPNAIMVTYCAQGKFKRDLNEIGFVVETLDGPPGKKEMVRATKS